MSKLTFESLKGQRKLETLRTHECAMSKHSPREKGRDALLEGRSDGSNFVDDIFDGDDTVLAERLFDDGVGGKGDSLLVDLSVTSLVDEFSDSLEVRLSTAMHCISTTSEGDGGSAGRTRR